MTQPFRPPHGFECPVCFPPEDRPVRGVVLLLAAIFAISAVMWLVPRVWSGY